MINIFKKWEVNIIKLLPITKEKNRYIIVVMNYFLRWSEVRLLKATNAGMIVIFLYKKIIYRFKA